MDEFDFSQFITNELNQFLKTQIKSKILNYIFGYDGRNRHPFLKEALTSDERTISTKAFKLFVVYNELYHNLMETKKQNEKSYDGYSNVQYERYEHYLKYIGSGSPRHISKKMPFLPHQYLIGPLCDGLQHEFSKLFLGSHNNYQLFT